MKMQRRNKEMHDKPLGDKIDKEGVTIDTLRNWRIYLLS